MMDSMLSRALVVVWLVALTFHAPITAAFPNPFGIAIFRSHSVTRLESSPNKSTWSIPRRLDRTAARLFLEDLLPSRQYSDRIGLGRQAQDISGGMALLADDPRLTMTYAEFPLPSYDILLDVALKEYSLYNKDDAQTTMKLVDIGSGLGRIALYTALSRVSSDCAWHVDGIEISPLLHETATFLMEEAIDRGVVATASTSDVPARNSVSLHLGSAQESATVLSSADIVFAYSTAFSAKKFSPELSALILDAEWSELLGRTCRPGCVAITTDRALDPMYGWQLLQRIDVDNPEVFGSTGYIHVLESERQGRK
jgi:hypothetical protein